MSDSKSSPIFIIGEVGNHSTFYESIAEKNGLDVDCIRFFPELFDWRTIYSLINLVVEEKPQSFYVEEFTSSRGLAAVALIMFIFRNIDFYFCVHNANRFIYNRVGSSNIVPIFFRRFLKNKWSGIVVVCDEMADYLSMAISVPVQVISFRLAMMLPMASGSRVIFSIPGNVDIARRDYQVVLRAMLGLREYHQYFEVHFLGLYSPSKIDPLTLNLLDEVLLVMPSSIVLYSSYIESNVFDGILQRTSAMIGNLNQFYSSKDGVEIYGVTKETGIRVLTDATGIPCLLSSKIPMGKFHQKYFHFKDHLELSALMLDYIEIPKSFH